MNFRKFLLIPIMVLCSIFSFASKQKESKEYTIKDVKVVKVYDGDTITVLKGKDKLRIRFYGIDAPELKQNYGKISRKNIEFLLDTNVDIVVKNKDPYGRLVGEVFTKSGINVNKKQLADGKVFMYHKYTKDSDYERLEQEAKSKKIGVWDSKNRVTSPEEYRKSHK